ncbi:universal stress protein [Natronobeatus ordinarius]|uniref:universal stress protein n=1 Tax=Natronobeatus ordinarius TaxID=2963433 RepID=UPI0020CFD273|nr:universal stress protein [Natronobeatus ordinarius]
MYDDVLVATDGSEVATDAVLQGIDVARAVDATVHVLSVVDDADRERHEGYVEATATEATDAGLTVETAVREGRPSSELLAYAEEADVDLVVLGTHGRTGLEQVLVGSVALEVIRDSSRPVLTVGGGVADVPRPIDDVLVATDGWSGSGGAVEHALALASAFDARLHAFYAVDVQSNAPEVRESFDEHGRRTTAEIAERAEESGLEATRTVVQGEPHEKILAHADESSVDLIVMGTESKSTLGRLVVGSVSQRVVPNARVPVLTVRTLEEA